jgi:hypothetical protein
MSLLFVPAFFAVMDDLGGAIWRVSRRFIAAEASEEKKPEGAPETAIKSPAE